jgi:isopentenyl-diphosphate delta-isomerase
LELRPIPMEERDDVAEEQAQRSARKRDHLRLALAARPRGNGLEDVVLIHDSLPELALDEVDLSTELGGRRLPVPVLINAMTGGVAEAEPVNRAVGRLGAELSLPVAVGSQRAALRDPALRRTYTVVREENPHGVVIGNLGAGATPDEAEDAVAMLGADFLQLHLNAPQELQMPEGDRDFRGRVKAIERVVARLSVPVIVKECGFGMSRETARRLWDAGVRIVDVAGRGGTNFARIEFARRNDAAPPDPGLLDWGIPTAASLWEVVGARLPGLEVVASGGIRFGSEVAKALALGARAAGIAGFVLRTLHKEGYEGARRRLSALLRDLRAACLLAGARDLKTLATRPHLIRGETRAWIEARRADVAHTDGPLFPGQGG